MVANLSEIGWLLLCPVRHILTGTFVNVARVTLGNEKHFRERPQSIFESGIFLKHQDKRRVQGALKSTAVGSRLGLHCPQVSQSKRCQHRGARGKTVYAW